jgi:hypothetical protein
MGEKQATRAHASSFMGKATLLAFAISASSHSAAAFQVAPSPVVFQKNVGGTQLDCFKCVQDGVMNAVPQESIVRDSSGWKNECSDRRQYGPRQARIIAPLTTMLGATFATLPNFSAAYAEVAGTYLAAVDKYFPTALTSRKTADKVIMALRARGYTSQNTLFGASVCSDEINVSARIPKCLYNELAASCGNKAFALGGLAGVPFVGKSGLGACVGHVPDQGKLLILFAPHVGISEKGEVGPIRRNGKTSISNACGAAIGAYKVIKSQMKFESAQYDEQEALIVKELTKRLDGVTFKDESDAIPFVTYQMFSIVRDVLFQEIKNLPSIADKCSEVALLGGVIVNQFENDDYFQPLSFQVGKKDYFTEKLSFVDIYDSTFGTKPGSELTKILDNKAKAGEVLKEVTV